MHIYPFRASFPNDDFIASSDSFFSNVKQEYADYAKSGFFDKVDESGIYIHKITGPKRTYIGIEACVDIADYENGLVKKHEHTLPAKEQKQMQLLLQRNAMVKPVLLFHHHLPELHEIMHEIIYQDAPFFETTFEEADMTHTFWCVNNPYHLRTIIDIYAHQVPDCYIADGHHRSSTVAMLYQRRRGKSDESRFRYLHCALFSSDQLDVHDYNRIFFPLTQITPSRFVALLSRCCEIWTLEKAMKPSQKYEMTMCINEEWYGLRWKPSLLQKQNKLVELDARLLDRYVFNEILGVPDVRTDQRLTYVEGTSGLESFKELASRKENMLGFCLYPVSLDDLRKISDADEVMPPKSTWFEPRMKNGLLVYEV